MLDFSFLFNIIFVKFIQYIVWSYSKFFSLKYSIPLHNIDFFLCFTITGNLDSHLDEASVSILLYDASCMGVLGHMDMSFSGFIPWNGIEFTNPLKPVSKLYLRGSGGDTCL